MYGGLIMLYIWAALALGILVGLCYLTAYTFWKAAETKKAAEKYATKIKKRTDDKYNKYISLTPSELNLLLIELFSEQLELASIVKVSEKDPDAVATLYKYAVENLLLYLGNESITAIDYYYGKDYVIKWCETKFKLLENRGVISSIINKDIRSDGISRQM